MSWHHVEIQFLSLWTTISALLLCEKLSARTHTAVVWVLKSPESFIRHPVNTPCKEGLPLVTRYPPAVVPTHPGTFNLQCLCGFTGLWDDEPVSESSQPSSATTSKPHGYSLPWMPLPQVQCAVPPSLWEKMLHTYHRTTNTDGAVEQVPHFKKAVLFLLR